MLLLALRLPIVMAIVLSWHASHGSASFRPIAIALSVALGKDLFLEVVQLPARWDLAVWLSTPVVSAWAAVRVLGRRRGAQPIWWWAAFAATVLMAPDASLWWSAAPAATLCASIVVQFVALLSWLRSRCIGTTADAAAIVLLAGDAFMLLGPAGFMLGDEPLADWWIVAAQTSVTACGICALLIAREIRSGA